MLIRSVLASALIVGAAYEGVNLAHGGALWPTNEGRDDVSAVDRQARVEAFAAMPPLPVQTVDDRDLDKATQTMGLPEPQRQALVAAASPTPLPAPAVVARTPDA